MAASPAAQRRQSPRLPTKVSLRFLHAPTGRSFAGRCVDVSAGGLQMLLSPSVPVMAGHRVEITLSQSTDVPGRPDATSPIAAEVIRVDRRRLITDGVIAVGVKFLQD